MHHLNVVAQALAHIHAVVPMELSIVERKA